MEYNQKIRAFLLQQGASEVGFSKVGETLKEVLPPEYHTAATAAICCDYCCQII